jgi:hypothetical protein
MEENQGPNCMSGSHQSWPLHRGQGHTSRGCISSPGHVGQELLTSIIRLDSLAGSAAWHQGWLLFGLRLPQCPVFRALLGQPTLSLT